MFVAITMLGIRSTSVCYFHFLENVTCSFWEDNSLEDIRPPILKGSVCLINIKRLARLHLLPKDTQSMVWPQVSDF